MKIQRPGLRHVVHYVGLRLLLATVPVLPRRPMLWLGSRIGDILWLFRLRRRVVEANMAYVGMREGDERKQLVRKLYRTMGRYGVDQLRPPGSKELHPSDQPFGPQSPTEPGRGTLVLFAHFGNWELGFALFARQFGPMTVVVRSMRNQLVNTWLTAERKKSRLTLISPQNVVRNASRILSEGGTVAIAIDQWPGRRGGLSEFLGKETPTTRTAAGLVRLSGCRTVAIHVVMQEDGTYCPVLHEIAGIGDGQSDKRASVAALQQAHNDLISDWIRQQPEHWFGWLHRRFKNALPY